MTGTVTAAPDTYTVTFAAGDGVSITSQPMTISVTKADTTLTYTGVSPPTVVGQQTTFEATVAPSTPGTGTPTGSVTFNDGFDTCTGSLNGASPDVATCNFTYSQTVTSQSVSAEYEGDSNFEGSNESTLVSVGKDSTTTTMTASPSSPIVGQPVTYTVNVGVATPGSSTPTGEVQVSDNSGTVCRSVSLDASGTGTCTATYGSATSDTVTADYLGDANETGSSSQTTVAFGKDSTSTSVGAPSPSNQVVVGQTVTLSATVAVKAPGAGKPTGAVDFTGPEGAACDGTLSKNAPYTASCTTSYAVPTSGTITATYEGDSGDVMSSSTTSVSVGAASTDTSVAASPSSAVTGQRVTLTATVSVTPPGSGTATGKVTFTGNSGTICTARLNDSSPDTASCPTSYPGPTSDAVTATYAGDGNFTGSGGNTDVGVAKGATDTVLSSSSSASVSGQTITFRAAVDAAAPAGGSPGGTVNFSFRDGWRRVPTCQSGRNAVILKRGTATCTVSGLIVAQSPLTVHTSCWESAAFSASYAPALSETIKKASANVAVSSSLNPDPHKRAVTLTAAVVAAAPGAGTPTGHVSWAVTSSHGAAVACRSTSNSTSARTLVATCVLTANLMDITSSPYSVRAKYLGDGNFKNAGGPLSEQVV